MDFQVGIHCARSDKQVDTKTPKLLFRSSLQPSQYAVSADGQRIYMLEPVTTRRDVLHVITR